MNSEKIEIMYFYSGLYENRRNLSEIRRKLCKTIKDISIRLVNVEDPKNKEITELYSVNMVPIIIFLTPEGEIAARRSLPLSTEQVVQDIAGKIYKGELPNQTIEENRLKIFEAFKSATQRNDLTDIVVEQVKADLMEADSEDEISELLNSHISLINHVVSDLKEFRKTLQKFSKKQHDFVV